MMIWERFSLEVFDGDKIFMKTLLSQVDFARVLIEPRQQLLDMEILLFKPALQITESLGNRNSLIGSENLFQSLRTKNDSAREKKNTNFVQRR